MNSSLLKFYAWTFSFRGEESCSKRGFLLPKEEPYSILVFLWTPGDLLRGATASRGTTGTFCIFSLGQQDWFWALCVPFSYPVCSSYALVDVGGSGTRGMITPWKTSVLLSVVGQLMPPLCWWEHPFLPVYHQTGWLCFSMILRDLSPMILEEKEKLGIPFCSWFFIEKC